MCLFVYQCVVFVLLSYAFFYRYVCTDHTLVATVLMSGAQGESVCVYSCLFSFVSVCLCLFVSLSVSVVLLVL
jgi:hypothetical protein